MAFKADVRSAGEPFLADLVEHGGNQAEAGGRIGEDAHHFEEMYGEIGTGFIHVHHLKPLSEIGKGYELNPITDLRPVCPNCHAMIHQCNPAYTIEELKTILRQRKRSV